MVSSYHYRYIGNMKERGFQTYEELGYNKEVPNSFKFFDKKDYHQVVLENGVKGIHVGRDHYPASEHVAEVILTEKGSLVSVHKSRLKLTK